MNFEVPVIEDIRNYETTYVILPDLDPEVYTAIIEKFNGILAEYECEITNQEIWGFKKLAYPIRKKMTGYYVFTEFKSDGRVNSKLDQEFNYDERIIRNLTVKLDKYASEYSIKRRNKLSGAAQESPEEGED